MITLIKVDEGPVDIYELRMQYLAKLKETDEQKYFLDHIKAMHID